MAISREQIERASPDAASFQDAQKLSVGRKLLALGREGDVAWCEVAGSGLAPYQVAFDGAEAAALGFGCSCPSRKIPCKHALALALRFVGGEGEFAAGQKPSWVGDWQKVRARRAVKAPGPAKPVDVGAQAKRIAAREEKVAGGLAELELWLRDVMRGGIASLPSQPYGFWDKIAARMTDAQCAGIARRLREMASVPHQSPRLNGGWHDEMLHRLGGLHLLCEGYKRLGSLSPERQADVRALIGWNVDQSELLQRGQPIRDRWLALAYSEEESPDGLRSGRTWLWGKRLNRPALIIQFGFGGASIGAAAPIGTSFDGDLVFFPGSLALRALVKEKFGPPMPPDFAPPGISTAQVLGEWARALALFPWLESLPCILNGVVPIRHSSTLWARDESGTLELSTRGIDEWALISSSGGRPLGLFGLWNGSAFEPLATLQNASQNDSPSRVIVAALPASGSS